MEVGLARVAGALGLLVAVIVCTNFNVMPVEQIIAAIDIGVYLFGVWIVGELIRKGCIPFAVFISSKKIQWSMFLIFIFCVLYGVARWVLSL